MIYTHVSVCNKVISWMIDVACPILYEDPRPFSCSCPMLNKFFSKLSDIIYITYEKSSTIECPSNTSWSNYSLMRIVSTFDKVFSTYISLLKNHSFPAKFFIKIILQEIHAYFSLIFFFAWNSFDFWYKI